MISKEKLLQVSEIITHVNCADGIASAIILHDALPNAKISFVQYGTQEHRNLKPAPVGITLFCDFSPHPETVQEFVKVGAIVLDHHKTAKDIVSAFGDNGVYGDEETALGTCGAMLAFREVWNVVEYPSSKHDIYELAHLADIYDTHQVSNKLYKKACIQFLKRLNND